MISCSYRFNSSLLLFSSILLFKISALFTEVCAQSNEVFSLKDTVKLYEYHQLGDAYLNQNNFDSASYYYLQAGELSRNIKYKKGIADFISGYIKVLNSQGKYQESLQLCLESIEICKELKNEGLLAVAYNNLGNAYIYLGDFKSAAVHIMDALQIAEKIGDVKKQQKFCNNIASVFLSLDEKEKSNFYANKSYQLAIQNQDSLGMASSLVNLAYSESLNGRRENAIKYMKQVLKFGQDLNDPSYILDAYINLADLVMQEKKYKLGLDYYLKAQEVLISYPVPDYELYVYWGLAQCYYFLAAYPEANKNLLKSIEVGESINASNELRKIYLLGSQINEELNDDSKALDYRKKFQVLNDSLVNAETQQSVHRLEIEYQTSVKEKAIAEQELIIANNQVEIQKKNIYIILAISIVLALMLVIIIFTLVYRHKRKTYAEKLQYIQKQNEIKVLTAMMEGEEKERSRLARELHDGVGGILSATKMHLSILKNDENKFIESSSLDQSVSMIDYASQEIRTIAHNLSPNILLNSDLEKAINHFCNSVSNSALHVDCYILGSFPKFNNSFKLVIYRIVQELINNIIKHSHANHALVQISLHDNILSLTVEDNGVGFEFNESNGIGLSNLKERVSKMNGQMTINSQIGNGTAIYLEFEISSFIINNSVLEASPS